MTTTLTQLREHFQLQFHRPAAGAVRAPGRVNLIGEHTDYNDGYVLPIAIQRETVALAAPRDDRTVTFLSLQAQDEPASISLDEPITPGEPVWANYAKGVAAGLVARADVKLIGCDVLLSSTVPIGGGLSSSASLEVAAALALLGLAGATVPARELARLCQKAEHEFAGAPCGIMDQSIAILGQAGRALLLDCRNGQTIQLPFDDPDLVVLVVDTEVHHEIAGGEYGKRRTTCYSAAAKMGLGSLREADADMVARAARKGTLDATETKRARHVVTEIKRTVDAIGALRAGDYREFGQLMYGSHASLRDDYEVTCRELDTVVDAASGCPGVFGARMTGGGFGGCAIVLAEAGKVKQVTETIQKRFFTYFGRACPIFATRAVAGAGPAE